MKQRFAVALRDRQLLLAAKSAQKSHIDEAGQGMKNLSFEAQNVKISAS